MEETNQVTNYLNEEKQQKLYRFNYAVHKAKGALFFAAGLSLIPMMLSYSRTDGQLGSFEIILFVLLFCSFIGLSFFASKKPFTALVIAALVYVAYILMLALPFLFSQGISGLVMAIYSGCLFKIIVLTILGKASQVAKPMQLLKEEMDL
ncbi:MAG: hypothetical protein JWR61_1070 [Ferruginibacter sp.]|uniref:hypothetical protein n=1 Tax=Ferruginibacter sp. TaxID=1940288 RepID=UPI0026595745|nr:hypothetical protein [Ferruginibacter sp.]MDB5276115.1 hypothetical protein [Ferruginibacter sp.]